MAKKDLFEKGFDESTKIKLLLFRKYIESWIPTFIHSSPFEKILIYDFFAGEGQDVYGEKGSPLIIMDCLKQYCEDIRNKNKKIFITLNDYDKKKAEKLLALTQAFKEKCGACNHCSLEVKNDAFQNLFSAEYQVIKQATPTFLLIDQYGVSQVTESVFRQLVDAPRTDFLFFISSATIRRFKDNEGINKKIKVSQIQFEESKPYECHEKVYNYYKTLINGDYYLGRFSIKKVTNYYGLIFGSHHPLGLEKFLSASWSIDVNNGEANHEIDETKQYEGSFMNLFDEVSGISTFKTKLESYEEHLLDYFSVPRTNQEIYKFSLESGISIPKTVDILRKLEKERRICVEGGDKRKSGAFYLSHNSDKIIKVAKNENNKN
ncbi:three-Cys-motif partner protein TcmP [Culturomica sp.]|uniref:three-Cys-motif partner protein TcmP n=1 Tax=Culturomica sp. TaxID=1926652 RepID=UPI000E85F5F9|nr:three-Cys-motif partner protein TcmP [Culturomica sp.]HBO25987.1 hypothetical protein [Culturomica sp.]